MDYLLLIGRILYGGFFLYSGIGHFTKLQGMAGYAASRGVPFPKLGVMVSGLFIVLGGLGVMFGIYMEWALVLIAIFLLVVTFTMHRFWSVTDPNMKMSDRINFGKNLALLGSTLMLLNILLARGTF